MRLRRTIRVVCVSVLAVSSAAVVSAAFVARPAGATTVQRFRDTASCGTEVTTTVPAGTTSLTVTLTGAAGGHGGALAGSNGGIGGFGDELSFKLPVGPTDPIHPGQKLGIVQGCQGVAGSSTSLNLGDLSKLETNLTTPNSSAFVTVIRRIKAGPRNVRTGALGGFGVLFGTDPFYGTGAGGGGSSWLVDETSTTALLAVAGGGGGGGEGVCAGGTGGMGGMGGGTTGAAGANNTFIVSLGSRPGPGGVGGGGPSVTTLNPADTTNPSTNGTGAHGGSAVTWTAFSTLVTETTLLQAIVEFVTIGFGIVDTIPTLLSIARAAGGGGGGGSVGGGGGGAGLVCGGGGGGGGGQSFVSPVATLSFQAPVQSVGNGFAEITFVVTPTFPTDPGQPTGVAATPGNGQAIVSFTAPTTNGRSIIKRYNVTATDETNPSAPAVVALGTSSPIDVTTLTNGDSYFFSVSATNSIGTGPASAPSNTVTPSSVPGVPTNLSAAPGNGSVDLTWTKPTTDGGATVTGYGLCWSTASAPTSCASPTQAVSGGTTLSATVNGLVNGTRYYFSVVAENGRGPSAISDANEASATPMLDVAVSVSGSETYGSGPSFAYTTTPTGVNVSSLSCTTVNHGTAISPDLAAGGSYTIDGSTCSGTAGSAYSLSFVGAADGFTVRPATPAVTWSAPVSITYGTALGGTQLDATASVPGSFSYTPPSGTVLSAGTHALQVVFTPTTTNYNTATKMVELMVNQAPLKVAAPSPTVTYGQATPTLQPTYTGFVHGDTAASLSTAPTCVATGAGLTPAAGTYTVTCSGAVDPNYSISYVNGELTVNPATPTITWARPLTITYGTALGASELDANVSVAGSLSYTPAPGTVLQPGTHSLKVSFTPSTQANYTTASKTVTLTVGFTQACITTSRHGPLTIGSGDALCLTTGGSFNGPVTIAAGGSLWLTGGTITGPLRSRGAAAITLCGSTLNAPVTITGTRGPVLLGGTGCAGNRFGAPVHVTSNSGGVSFVNNRASAPVTITQNAGPFVFSGNTFSAPVRVKSNG